MPHTLTRTLLQVAILIGLTRAPELAPLTVPSPTSVATTPPRDTLVALVAGDRSSCVTTTSGAGWCWGLVGGEHGTSIRMRDRAGRPAPLRTVSPWTWTACALSTTGEPLCDVRITGGWKDSAGHDVEPPDGCRNYSCLVPLPGRGALPPGPLRAVTSGSLHACALAPNGAAFCWGDNRFGQLGNGMRAPRLLDAAAPIARSPVAVIGGLRFRQIDAGGNFTCGVTAPDDAIYCWGYGHSGETGDSTAMTSCNEKPSDAKDPCRMSRPTRVLPESLPGDYTRPTDVRFSTVSAGEGLACAVDVRGTAYCWGSNYRCALGRCRSSDSHRAHRIQIAGRVAEIGAGDRFACARTVDERILCWGDNTAGQLGSLATVNAERDGLPPDYLDANDVKRSAAAHNDDPCFLGGRCTPSPVEVSSGRRWSALAVGTTHACAASVADGGIYCWGGADSVPLGGHPVRERCVNRSATWRDTLCQYTPVRIAGLPRLAYRAAHDESLTPTHGPVRVRVSRRELRVEFPTDTTRGWGWSDRDDRDYSPFYSWNIVIEGMDGARNIGLMVGRERSEARDFASLAQMLDGARAAICTSDMIVQCTDSALSTNVEHDAVVIALRDSARIARLFGMRPAYVSTNERRPDEPYRFSQDSVRVEYVAPQLPFPTDSMRADAERSRRASEARISFVGRSISGGEVDDSVLWLAVGDSTAVGFEETHCTYDSCVVIHPALSDSGWTVADERIARLLPIVPDTGRLRFLTRSLGMRYLLKALAPGRTTLRVTGVHGPSDTEPSRQPPPTVLERDVLVTPAIGRVEILTRRDTVRIGESFPMHVRVTARDGSEIVGAPAKLAVLDRRYESIQNASRTGALTLTELGRTRVIARLGAFADTMMVAVVDSATSAPRR